MQIKMPNGAVLVPQSIELQEQLLENGGIELVEATEVEATSTPSKKKSKTNE